MKKPILSTFILLCLTVTVSTAQRLVGDWTFHPNYTLFRNAENYPGNKIESPKSKFELFKTIGAPIHFYEQAPTQRITNFLDNTEIPTKQFTQELWVLNHVNLPVGAMMCLRNPNQEKITPWLIGYYDEEIVFHLTTNNSEQTIKTKIEKKWKKYWSHIVATYDGQAMQLFLNGVLIATESISGDLEITENTKIEMAGYFAHESYMEISNLVKSSRLHDGILTPKQITERFNILKNEVEKGAFFGETFHFNAGPYLHYATQHSINIIWETNKMATATIEYGKTLPLDKQKTIDQLANIQEITLDSLEMDTRYYYQIIAIAPDGSEMKSGILTFGTAVPDNAPFSFCILGDTESRPHINHRLGEMVWEERPNFILHLGDITDGGKEPYKFQWNYEYFTGIVPVASRIPIFPVPGNGEGDLYWYEKYHRLPESETFYSFKYADSEFFMLNSNAKEELLKGGKQYDWLQQKLTESTAKWKFVAHHHCPFSSDENDFGDTWKGKPSTQSDPRFDDLKALYESGGVDVVFYGHVHAYERTYPLTNGVVDTENGVTYLKSGGAGGHLEDFSPTPSSFSNKIQRGNHFCRVGIYDTTFVLKMYDLEGRLKDIFELKK